MRLVLEVGKRLIVLQVHLETVRQWAKTTLQGGENANKMLGTPFISTGFCSNVSATPETTHSSCVLFGWSSKSRTK